MCVIGEVTLMDIKLATLMRKPKTPCTGVKVDALINIMTVLTVIIEPDTKVESGLIWPSTAWLGPNSSFITPGSSPTSTMTGASTNALRKFVYHDR